MSIRLAFSLLQPAHPTQAVSITSHQRHLGGGMASTPLRETVLHAGTDAAVTLHDGVGLLINPPDAPIKVEVCHCGFDIPRWVEMRFCALVENACVELGRRRIRPGDAERVALAPGQWAELLELPHGVEGHL